MIDDDHDVDNYKNNDNNNYRLKKKIIEVFVTQAFFLRLSIFKTTEIYNNRHCQFGFI